MCIYVHTYVYIHIYAHTHTHTHIYIYILVGWSTPEISANLSKGGVLPSWRPLWRGSWPCVTYTVICDAALPGTLAAETSRKDLACAGSPDLFWPLSDTSVLLPQLLLLKTVQWGTPRPGCCEGLEPGRLVGRWALRSFLSLREKEAANSEAEMRPIPSPPPG